MSLHLAYIGVVDNPFTSSVIPISSRLCCVSAAILRPVALSEA